MHCTVGCLREHCLSQGLEADATRELNRAVSSHVRVGRRDSLYRPELLARKTGAGLAFDFVLPA